MKVIINRKLTGPGHFTGHTGTPAISCSFKAAAGYLYPLERGFIYVHKPPIHIRFEEIASVNFARGGGSTRSFDFEIELTSGVVHTFSSIEKEEYGKLFDFITAKKLRVKNRGKSDKPNYDEDFGDSDQEDEPDAYLARVKAEAQERDGEENQDSEEEGSTDEDFNPNQDESDVAEEYDSNPNSSDSEDSDASAASHKKEKKDKEKKEKKEKKSKSAKTVSEKPRKQRKSKKERDENKPKRPPSAFMLWLSSTRDSIKADNPGLSITDIAKKGGEMWRELKDKSEWETKAAKAKKDYMASMKEYQTSGGGKEKTKEKKTENKKKETKKDSPSKQMSGSGFKSKEYISDDDSSSDESKKSAKEKSDNESEEEKDKKKKTEKRPTEDTGKKTSKKTKRNQSDESDEEEPIQSTPSSSEDESKSD